MQNQIMVMLDTLVHRRTLECAWMHMDGCFLFYLLCETHVILVVYYILVCYDGTIQINDFI